MLDASQKMQRSTNLDRIASLSGVPFVHPASTRGLWIELPSVTIDDFHAALDAQSIGSRQYDARHTYATKYLTISREPSLIMADHLGYRVQMLLSTYAEWLGSASYWSELEKLPARIKMVCAWHRRRRQAINHRCYTRRTSL